MNGQWIWLPDIQNDFAARMDWCLNAYENANHYPSIDSSLPRILYAEAGEKITLDAGGSNDPDGDKLGYLWWHYHFAGTNPYGVEIPIEGSERAKASLVIPEDAAGKELHIILEVADSGEPQLKQYKRTIIRVKE
jgi:hypothetical protein